MSEITFNLELSTKDRKDKRTDILLRFTQSRKYKRISTRVHVFRKDFSKEAGFGKWIKKTDEESGKKNKVLKDLLSKAGNTISEIEKLGNVPTSELVINILKGKETTASFMIYTSKVIDRLKEAKQVGTYRKYSTSKTKLEGYIKDKKLSDLTFNDITVGFLSDYDAYLKSKGNHINTVEKELKVIRAILYRAIKDDLFPQARNPFFKFSIKSAKTRKEKLSEEEVIQMENLELPEGELIWHVRNYWLFSFYCYGIRFSDIATLTWSQIVNDRLRYDMHKTGNPIDIKLRAKSQNILDYYKKYRKEESKNDFIFPLLEDDRDYTDPFFAKQRISIKNTIVNNYLKKIAQKAEIQTHLSFHISRHSFSNISIKKGVNVHALSAALGHSSISITQTYIKSIDTNSLDKTFDAVFGE